MIDNYRNHVIKQRHQNSKMPEQGNYPSQNRYRILRNFIYFFYFRAYSTVATTTVPNEASAEEYNVLSAGNSTTLMSHSQPCLFSSNPNKQHPQEK